MSPSPGDGPAAARPRDFVASSSLSAHTLPEGTRLLDYEVTGLIGEGGFGIVYLAYDHSLQRRVAIKEYMPSAMATRAKASAVVVVKSDRHLDTFKLGLKSFVNEARLLARFDHPSLVKVYRFWEENGTAYMVMPYYEGPTLKRALAELGRAPTEAELRQWLRPLLDALTVMHTAHCFHRDIAPDNILLTPGGPLLLDFGAARRVIGDMTHALTVVLKPGFAPIEQYGEVSSMAQGAWTDLYALASVVYAAVTGHAPMSSVERLMDDRLEPLSVLAASRYSEPFLTAIDAALALRPQDRPQNVAAFRQLMDGRASHAAPPPGFDSTYSAPLELVLPEPAVAAPLPAAAATPAVAALQQVQPVKPREAAAAVAPTAAPATAAAGAVAASAHTVRHAPAATPRPRRNGAAAYAAAAAGGVVVLAVVGYFSGKAGAPAETAATVPVPAAKAASTPTPAVITEPAAATPEASAEPVTPFVTDDSAALREAPSGSGPTPTPTPAAAVAATPRATAAEPTRHRATDRPAPKPNAGATAVRCSDILQKASLEPLTPAEAAYLKQACR